MKGFQEQHGTDGARSSTRQSATRRRRHEAPAGAPRDSTAGYGRTRWTDAVLAWAATLGGSIGQRKSQGTPGHCVCLSIVRTDDEHNEEATIMRRRIAYRDACAGRSRQPPLCFCMNKTKLAHLWAAMEREGGPATVQT